MSKDTPITRTLRRAALIVGGDQHLAEQWDIPADILAEWLAGATEPPVESFI